MVDKKGKTGFTAEPPIQIEREQGTDEERENGRERERAREKEREKARETERKSEVNNFSHLVSAQLIYLGVLHFLI